MDALNLLLGGNLDPVRLKEEWRAQAASHGDEVGRVRLRQFVDSARIECPRIAVFVDGNHVFIKSVNDFIDLKVWLQTSDDSEPRMLRKHFSEQINQLHPNDGYLLASISAALIQKCAISLTEQLANDRGWIDAVVLHAEARGSTARRDFDPSKVHEVARHAGHNSTLVAPQILCHVFDARTPSAQEALQELKERSRWERGSVFDSTFAERISRGLLPCRDLKADVPYGLKNEYLDAFDRMADSHSTVFRKVVSGGRDNWYFQEKGVDCALAIHGVLISMRESLDAIALFSVDRDYVPLIDHWKQLGISTWLLFWDEDGRRKPTRDLADRVGGQHVISARHAFEASYETTDYPTGRLALIRNELIAHLMHLKFPRGPSIFENPLKWPTPG